MIGHRGLGGPCSSDPWARGFGDMPIPALCPGHALRRALPSTDRLPSTVVGFTPDNGPTVRGLQTVARDPELTCPGSGNVLGWVKILRSFL